MRLKLTVCLTLLFLAGCTASPEHALKVEQMRASLPYRTRISYSHSMQPLLNPGGFHRVVARSYDKLAGNEPAVFWPEGSPFPVCHLTGSRIGTDSWSTHGIGQADDTYRWILTRDNYIGMMEP